MTSGAFLTLVHAAAVTLGLSVSAIALGLPLGLAMAVARWRRLPVISPLIAAYVSIVRPTPMITMCLFVFFLLPLAGIELSPVAAGILALTLNTAAFNCEIWRAVLVAFPRDQLEAAAALGMTGGLMFRRVILPQLLRSSLGPLVNEMTLLIKVTPAVAAIGIVEITRAASRIGAQTYEPLVPFLVATLIYATLIALFVRGQRLLERRLAARYGYDPT